MSTLNYPENFSIIYRERSHWKQLANIWGDSKESLGELVLSLSSGMIPALKELSAIVKEAAEYWQKLFTPPDAKGALEQQRIKIAEQIEAEQRLLNYLKNTPAGRISAGPDGVAQVEARIAALNAAMQTASRSLINMEGEKPKSGSSSSAVAGQVYDEKWLEDYSKNVDAAWKREVEKHNAIGELVNVETKWQEEAFKKQEKDQEEWLQSYLDNVDKAWDAEVKRSQGLGELAVVNQRLRDDELKRMEESMQSWVQLSKRTAWSMQENFSDFFFDAMTGKLKSLSDYWNAFLKSLQRAIADFAAQQLVQQLFGSTGGSKGSSGGGWVGTAVSVIGNVVGSMLHEGGVVGRDGEPVLMPKVLFFNAPRLHKGLMPDEYPAVLQKGETVIPRGGWPRGGWPSNSVEPERREPKIDITIINNSSGQVGAKSEMRVDDMLRKVDIYIEDVTANSITSGGKVSRAIRTTFGAHPLIGGR